MIKISTPKVEDEETLRGIINTLRTIFWDFKNMSFNVLFSNEGQRYALSSSGEDFGKNQTVIYQYTELIWALSAKIQEWKSKEDYPFEDKKVAGIYINPLLLNNVQKSTFKSTSFYFFIEEAEDTILIYTANRGKIYTQSPSIYRLDKQGHMHFDAFGSVYMPDKHDDLLAQRKPTPFRGRYFKFLLRVE